LEGQRAMETPLEIKSILQLVRYGRVSARKKLRIVIDLAICEPIRRQRLAIAFRPGA